MLVKMKSQTAVFSLLLLCLVLVCVVAFFLGESPDKTELANINFTSKVERM